jgi:hypothetical protein
VKDEEWDQQHRGETETQRLDRNWADLLQELRVVQTGVQLLTGFLLTIPFQPGFARLDPGTRRVYLGTVLVAVASTAALVAPVSIHRMLFRQHLRKPLVCASHRLAQVGLLLLGVALCGMVKVIFSLVEGPATGWAVSGATAAVFLALWGALPLVLRER